MQVDITDIQNMSIGQTLDFSTHARLLRYKDEFLLIYKSPPQLKVLGNKSLKTAEEVKAFINNAFKPEALNVK